MATRKKSASTKERDALLERVRDALRGKRLVERRMMGSVCLMIRGNMLCGVKGPDLMVRVGQAAYDAALQLPDVRPLVIGGKHPKGFVVVGSNGLRTSKQLESWLLKAMSFVDSLPAK